MQAHALDFQLSDDSEQIIRSYKCFTLNRWFISPTTGYLTVTNKRIVFHSSGKSLTGKSLLINEMPLEDVAGLSVYEGLSFNLILFLLFNALAYLATGFFISLLSFLVNYWVVGLLILPFTIIWILNNNILSNQLQEQIFDYFNKIFKDRFKDNQDLSVYLSRARIPLYVGLVIFGWLLTSSSATEFGFGTSIVGRILLFAIYSYIFINWVGRTHSFTLRIGSKTMKDSGIFIPGSSFNILPGRETTAMQGLGGRPAEDSMRVTRELGAMLMDLQQLGDFAIEKWKE